MTLNDIIQQKLRNIGKLSKEEIMLKEGDLYIALNVITNIKRVIENDMALQEALSKNTFDKKRVLKG